MFNLKINRKINLHGSISSELKIIQIRNTTLNNQIGIRYLPDSVEFMISSSVKKRL